MLSEFEELAATSQASLSRGRRLVVAATRARRDVEEQVQRERARASRLAAEIQRLKAGPSREPDPPVELEALAFAAASAGESDQRVLELEAALGAERGKVARYARYVEALEARLRGLAESEEPAAIGSSR